MTRETRPRRVVRRRCRWYRGLRGTSPTLPAQPRDGEPGIHNGELMNIGRVSPIDESASVVEEDELSRAGRRPGLKPTHLLRRHAEQLEIGVVTHIARRSTSCLKKCIKKCHRVNAGKTTLHVSNKLSAKRQQCAENPSRDDTSEEVQKL